MERRNVNTQKLVHRHTGVTLHYGARIRANTDAKLGGMIETVTVVGHSPERQEVAVNVSGDCGDNFWLHVAWCDLCFEPCHTVDDFFYQNQLMA